MQINGEAYFFINVWMNYLSLYLAGALCRLRIKKGAAWHRLFWAVVTPFFSGNFLFFGCRLFFAAYRS